MGEEPASERRDDREPTTRPNGVPTRRRRSRKGLLIGAGVIAVVVAIVWWLHARRFEQTDDAQIDADISNVGARVAGTIVRVNVVENQRVVAGDVIAQIDPTDLDVALARAQAAVAQARAQLAAEDPSVAITETTTTAALTDVTASYASANAGLAAVQRAVGQAEARLTQAQASDENAQRERVRGEEMFRHQAIARVELDRRVTTAASTSAAVQAAREALAAARAQVVQQRAQIAGVRGRVGEARSNGPLQVAARKAGVLSLAANLRLAEAQERQAALNRGYAEVRAPVSGIIARKAVNVGDHVRVGQALVALAQVDTVWVTANFRETQLRRMHPGQRVRVHVDAYAQDFDGTVESLGGATGSRTSVLPPENATGNYVKVVQRIPVRIRLDRGQAGLDRLRPGMSVEPKVRLSS